MRHGGAVLRQEDVGKPTATPLRPARARSGLHRRERQSPVVHIPVTPFALASLLCSTRSPTALSQNSPLIVAFRA